MYHRWVDFNFVLSFPAGGTENIGQFRRILACRATSTAKTQIYHNDVHHAMLCI